MKSKGIKRMVLGVVLILFLLSGSCATNPVSGGPELMLLSESDEIKLGKQTDAEVRKAIRCLRGSKAECLSQ